MVITEYFIKCDGERCETCFGLDLRLHSKQKQEERAKSYGWKIVNKKHYCPECSLAVVPKT